MALNGTEKAEAAPAIKIIRDAPPSPPPPSPLGGAVAPSGSGGKGEGVLVRHENAALTALHAELDAEFAGTSLPPPAPPPPRTAIAQANGARTICLGAHVASFFLLLL